VVSDMVLAAPGGGDTAAREETVFARMAAIGI
jgi:hypothetical protein